ncbi:UNVERIFIED_CONTAM: hypothetical protein Sradi_1503500 [Sesamum radiatum]|uniref:Uncharacterized protein n=1 Tax=Sesamum radiatum TaxID=300843 RepID=A0AAW2U832_SESRA
MALSLFTVQQKKAESLRDYLLCFNAATLEVPAATLDVKASVLSQGLLDGDFFKTLMINIEIAQASKEGR